MELCEAHTVPIDAFGASLRWVSDAAANLNRRSPVEGPGCRGSRVKGFVYGRYILTHVSSCLL